MAWRTPMQGNTTANHRRFYVPFSAFSLVRRFPYTLFLQRIRSCTCDLLSFKSVMSFSTHCRQVFLPLPFGLIPSTTNSLHDDTQSPLALCSTCPNQPSLPRLTTVSTSSTPRLSSNSRVVLLCFSETPHIHLTMNLSVLSNLRISSTFTAQVSLAYTNTRCTHDLYIFPFNFNDTLLAVNIGANSMNLPQAHLTRALVASSTPPPSPITSPK